LTVTDATNLDASSTINLAATEASGLILWTDTNSNTGTVSEWWDYLPYQ
jgi:hypothetical protein